MQARVTRTRASVGSRRRASGTFSTRTSPAPYMTVARIVPSLPISVGCVWGVSDAAGRRRPVSGVAGELLGGAFDGRLLGLDIHCMTPFHAVANGAATRD